MSVDPLDVSSVGQNVDLNQNVIDTGYKIFQEEGDLRLFFALA